MGLKFGLVLCVFWISVATAAYHRPKRQSIQRFPNGTTRVNLWGENTANQIGQGLSNIFSQLNISHPQVSSQSKEDMERETRLNANKDYTRELTALSSKYAGRTNSQEFWEAYNALKEKYLNGSSPLVASLAVLIVSLVIQMFTVST
ncbi:hypothetical protein V1264_020585 [Littorina saxatilis]